MLDVHEITPDEEAKLQLLRKVAGGGYLLSSLTSLAGLAAPDPVPGDHGAVVVLATLFVICGALLLCGRRLPASVVKLVAIGGGTIFTSATVAFVHPIAITPLFYIYPAMTSAYFGTRRDAALQLFATTAGFAGALALAHVQQASLMFVCTISIVTLVTVWVKRIDEQNRTLMERLAEVAATDGLTGLLNRRALATAAAREIARARSAQLPLSVVLFDLDHFKHLNDRMGHAAGDDALQRFARILGEECGLTDVAARMGGEEFLVVLFGRDDQAARAWAEHVAARLERESAEAGIPITTSAGVATSADGDNVLDELLLGADRALYAAKDAGRRRVMAAGDAGVGPLEQAA